jgi:hypothetical protein
MYICIYIYTYLYIYTSIYMYRWDEADKIGISNIGTELVQLIMSRNKEEDAFTRFR